MKPTVCAILPARNESDVIAMMVHMLLAVYPDLIKTVIVVDDGSSDTTASIVRTMARKDPRIRCIVRKPPHGVGLAIQEGLRHVPKESTYILSMDADFVRNVPDLHEFFNIMHTYDGIVGSRYLTHHSLIRYPFIKKVFNRLFHLLVHITYGVSQHDLTNNFKLYKKSVFDALPLTARDFAINAETGLYPVLLGYRIKEVPVTWYAREDGMGASKFNLLSVASSYFSVYVNASRFAHTRGASIIRFFLKQQSQTDRG